MGKLKLFLIILLIVITAGLIVFRYERVNSQIKKICFEGKCFNVEIADTEVEREKGLIGREILDQGAGMLFIFPSEARHAFWMRDTTILLDIIWMDKDWKVLAIKSAVPCRSDPCQYYNPEVNSKYVLEVNSSQVEESNIEIDQKGELKNH